MQKLDIDSLDLRSLRLLAHLLATASVTRTAEMSGLSQPATSRWLARLRAALGDPLLVRGPKGWGLTERAKAVSPRLSAILGEIDALFAPETFDPLASQRRFALASTDYGGLSVLPEALAALTRAAPAVGVDLKPWDGDTLDGLAEGRVDLALFADGALPADFHFRPLFSEDYLLVLRRGHPAFGPEGIDIAQCRRIGFLYPDGRGGGIDDALGHSGLVAGAPALTLPYFTLAPLVIASSDLVMVAPRRIAQRFAAANGLVALPAGPVGLEAKRFDYRLIWHKRSHNDPGHRWLRKLIADSVVESGPE